MKTNEKSLDWHRGVTNRFNYVVIRFNIPQIYPNNNEFKSALIGIQNAGFRCIYCREDFTGGALTGFRYEMRQIDGTAKVCSVNAFFFCRTCWKEIEAANDYRKRKLQARGMRNLYRILETAEAINK